MDTLKPVTFPKRTQSRLVAFQVNGQSKLDSVNFWKKKKTFVLKAAILCVWWYVGVGLRVY